MSYQSRQKEKEHLAKRNNKRFVKNTLTKHTETTQIRELFQKRQEVYESFR
jgi:shikimate kinase